MNEAKLILETLSTQQILDLADSVVDLTAYHATARRVFDMCSKEVEMRRHDTIIDGDPITDEASMALWLGDV